jgi:GNAT superfamily N-acetyltransferase
VIEYRHLELDEACRVFPMTPEERRIVEYPFPFARTHIIATVRGRIVGRIAANLSVCDSTRGYLGFFRVDPDLGPEGMMCARMLIGRAEAWLARNGANHGIAPVNYSTLFEYRYRLDPPVPGEPCFSWEPPYSPDHVQWFEQSGYGKLEDYLSRSFRDLSLALPFSDRSHQEAVRMGFSTRPIFEEGSMEQDLQSLFRINAASFQETFLSEPFDFAAYVSLNVPRHQNRLSEFSFFLVNPEGKEIGYFFLFADQGFLIWKTLAILPEYQKKGLAGFGIHHALTLAHERGITGVVAALVRRGAPSEQLLLRAEQLRTWEHRYAVFKKDFP